MKQSPFWEANSSSDSYKIPGMLRQSKGSLSHSQQPTVVRRDMPTFEALYSISQYDIKPLSHRANPSLEDLTPSVSVAVLFNIFAATLQICRPSPHPARRCVVGAVITDVSKVVGLSSSRSYPRRFESSLVMYLFPLLYGF